MSWNTIYCAFAVNDFSYLIFCSLFAFRTLTCLTAMSYTPDATEKTRKQFHKSDAHVSTTLPQTDDSRYAGNPEPS